MKSSDEDSLTDYSNSNSQPIIKEEQNVSKQNPPTLNQSPKSKFKPIKLTDLDLNEELNFDNLPSFSQPITINNPEINEQNQTKEIKEKKEEPNSNKAFPPSTHEKSTRTINCIKHLNALWKYELAAAVILFLLAVIVSLYGIIMINYIFFVSSISSYVFSPIYHGLCKEWLEFAFSIIQIIVASPLIDFYCIYILLNIKYFFDTIQAFVKFIPAAWKIAKYSGNSKRKNFLRSRFGDFRLWRQIVRLLLGLLAISVSAAILIVQIIFDKAIVAAGLFPYLFIVVQIILMVVPVYVYYFKCLCNMDCTELKCFKKLLNWYENHLKTWQYIAEEQKKVNNSAQTYESHFQDPFYHDLDKSSDSGQENIAVKKANTMKFAVKQLQPLVNDFYPIIVADTYLFLVDYTNQIAFDKVKKGARCFWLWIFTILNAAVLAFDLYRISRIHSSYFLASIILRLIMFPLLCYFNMAFIHLYKVDNLLVRYSRYVLTIISVIFIVAIFVVTFVANYVISSARIDSLPPPDMNQQHLLRYLSRRNGTLNHSVNYKILDSEEFEINADILSQSVCTVKVKGLDLIDAFGYALGPYDVERSPEIFNHQMMYFFGQDWSDFISYEVHHIRENLPFVVYHDSRMNATIVGFRGFSTGQELSVQIQMIEAQYVNPFFTDVVPFYDIAKEFFLSFYLKVAHNFGLLFFDTQPMISPLFTSLQRVIESKGLDAPNVIYTGLNTGGTFAKLLSAKNGLPGISFLAFPVYNDYLEFTFDLEDENSIEIYNIYNFDSLFTMSEPEVATNIGYYAPDSYFPRCSGKICNFKVASRLIYQNFCSLAENCGKGYQFDQYCRAILGDDIVDTIRENILDL